MTLPPQNHPNSASASSEANDIQLWNNETTWANVLETINQLDHELREAFIEDANQCVNSIEQTLLDHAGNHHADASQNAICRDLHNLKGASASVGLVELTNLLHDLEETFECGDPAGQGDGKASLYTAIDRIRKTIAPAADGHESLEYASTHGPATGIPQDTLSKRDGSIDGVGIASGMVRVEVGKLNRLMDHLARLVMLRNRRDTEIASLHSWIGELASTASKVRALGTSLSDLGQADDATLASDIANDIHEINRALNLRIRPLSDGNSAVTTFISDFRQELTSLRRTPLSGLAQRIHRAVVDAAQLEDKEVQFEFIGKQERLETDLQQKLVDALIHVARNAVCHGIESPDQRQNAGKARRGTISVSVTASPESLLFEVTDDGRGLAFESIHKKAIQLGLSGRNQTLPRDELARLILRPGFTTRNLVNAAAGRGIGLDVVASNIEKMRGWVDIQSTEGIGTTVRLHIPLPSLIQHILLLRHQGQCYGIPMHSVKATGDHQTNCPKIDLSTAFGLTPLEKNLAILIESQARNGGEASDDLLGQFTLLAEEVIGPEEMVVRPLPEILRSHPYLSGITLSGEGESVLILDPHLLARSSQMHQRHSDQSSSVASEPIECTTTNRLTHQMPRQTSTTSTAIVLSDSISTRMTVLRALEQSNYHIKSFSHFKEATQFLREHQVQLIIFDDRSRITHLIETAAKSSEQSALANTQFISIGNSPPESIRKTGFAITNVTRPIGPAKIRDAVNAIERAPLTRTSTSDPTEAKA